MKIKLIAPARKPEWGECFWDLKTFVKLTGKKAPGVLLALPTLAALTPNDVEVVITDENIEPIDFEEKVDLVGISFLTSLAPRAYEIADEFRQRGIKVVLGGIHASMVPEEAIQHADAVVIGEAEEIWPKLVGDLKRGILHKFYKAKCFPNLKNSPIPRWDLLNTGVYCYFTVQTTRGCPYNCDFCAVQVFNGRKYRRRSTKIVLKEIELLKSLDPKKPIFFADDNFIAKPTETIEFLKAIRQLNIRFWAQAPINHLDDDEMIALLYEAGCRVIFIGFESVSQESLDMVNKSKVNVVERYKQIVDKIHTSGIGVFGSFVLGFDADDKKIFEETVSFIRSTNIAFSMINILTPFPGTKIRSHYFERSRIVNNDWEKYDVENVCFKPSKLNIADIANGRNWVIREINTYGSLHERLTSLWKKGVFVRNKESRAPLLTRGRILLTLNGLMNFDLERTYFLLRSLWNPKTTSITSVLLALNFHDYAHSLANNKVRK